MMEVCLSRNRVGIRLTGERWAHIVEEHCELAGLREEVLATVGEAERVLGGREGELLAVRRLESSDKVMVVVYKETAPDDGFIITAFLTRRMASLDRRQQVWPLAT